MRKPLCATVMAAAVTIALGTPSGIAYEKIGAVEKARGDFNKALDIPKKGNDAGWAQDVARDHLQALDTK